MDISLPQRKALRAIQLPQQRIPLDQIIAVQGQNPLATGIETAGNAIGQAIAKRAALQQQGQQLAAFAKATGQDPTLFAQMNPSLAESAANYQSKTEEKKAAVAEKRTALELQLEKARTGTVEVDPTTGTQTIHPGVQGLMIEDDPSGYPRIVRDPDYKPKNELKVLGGGGMGSGVRGSYQQSTYVDSADSIPLLFDRDNKRYIRSSDSQAPKGTPVPAKGNTEAVQAAAKAQILLPKVSSLFQTLREMPEIEARAAVTPGVSKAFFPAVNQARAELMQAGFAFGGKQLTGTELQVIVDSLIPGPFDNQTSRDAKEKAINAYLTGSMDLAQAANLLGPAGDKIKAVLASNGPNKLRPISQRIRVRNKLTGQTGTISEQYLDPSKYERLP